MFAHFPAPYPDETFYSLVSRYRALERIKPGRLQRILFGVEKNTRGHLFPLPLKLVADKLAPKWGLSAEKLLQEHTVFPYYAAFNTPSKMSRIAKLAIEEGSIAALALGYFRKYGQLHFCPGCVQQDICEGREPYFRCSHHVVGNLACAAHSFLLESLGPKGTALEEKNLAFVPLADIPEARCTPGRPAHWRLVRLASDIEYCAFYWKRYCASDIDHILKSALERKSSSTFRRAAFYNRRFDSYVSSFNKLLPKGATSDTNFHDATSPAGRRVGQPFRLLLLLRALGTNPKTLFLHGEAKLHDPRALCVNPHCTHFQRKAPVRIDVYEPDWQQRVEVGCLQCGYTYAVKNSLIFTDKRPAKPVITDFGDAWNSLFRQVWMDPKLCFEEVINAMKVSKTPSLVFHAALKSNLPLDRAGASMSFSKLRVFMAANKRRLERTASVRRKLQKMKERIPTLRPAQARKIAPKAWAWAYMTDYLWFADFFQLTDNRIFHSLIGRSPVKDTPISQHSELASTTSQQNGNQVPADISAD